MGPSGDRQIDRIGLGEYFALLNPFIPPSPFGQPYFVEGAIHTVTGSGGDQLGSFEEDIHVKEFLDWTNRDAINVVPRNKPLRVEWQNGDSSRETVLIFGF